MDKHIDLSAHRKSGLTREFSALDLFVFNTFGYSLGLALTTNPPFIGGFAPGSNILLVLLFGFVASLVIGGVYGALSTAMPRNGGDYVYISRTLSRMLGFLANWGFTVAQIYGLAINCVFSISWAVLPAVYGFGLVTGDRRYIAAAGWLNTPAHSFLMVVAYLMVVFLFAWLGTRFVTSIFIPFFILGLLGPNSPDQPSNCSTCLQHVPADSPAAITCNVSGAPPTRLAPGSADFPTRPPLVALYWPQ